MKVNMSPRLNVSDLVIQRLSKLEEGSSGYLIGTSDDNVIYILGLVKKLEKSNDENDSNENDIISNLPANINYSGVFFVGNEENSENIDSEFCKKINGTSVVINFNTSSKNITSYFYDDGEIKKTEHKILTENDLSKSFVYLRLTATILLSCDFQAENIKEAFNNIQKKVLDGNAAFQVSDSELYILGNKTNDVSGLSPETTIDKLFSIVNKNENANKKDFKIINLNLYLKGTNNDDAPQLAPLIKYVKKEYKHVGIQLAVDGLTCASNNLKVKELHSILIESVHRNLDLNEKNILFQLKSNGVLNVSLPKTFHFFPSDCGHFLSIVYPTKQTTEQLKNVRENFHKLLSLPTDKPLFRSANSFNFENDNEKNNIKYLINPHEGLPKSGVPEGEVNLVKGNYTYHHYMQDNFDDSGWGCAYRSLQTIFSWFRLQGYTNLQVPTHKEIQQCLVNIGDKQSSFVGSKQWIGSTEVSFVLDTILGVTCRIVSVSSGEEMMTKGGELCHHFKTQGTPIMIGGGVLAHTILGVDYNKNTGAIKFLILDPHYTGSEDLKIIQNKGWCGWKGLEFWKKDAFYNMCLPLKPKCV